MTKRISERELLVPALKIMSEEPSGFVRTEKLIKKLEDALKPKGEDAAILQGRNDTKMSQKIRNLISHRDQPSNFIAKGYAEYISNDEGLRITDAGRKYLNQIED